MLSLNTVTLFFLCLGGTGSALPTDKTAVYVDGYQHDSYYENKTRISEAKFHINFSAKKFDDNGPKVTPDIAWNNGGSLAIGRDIFVAGLKQYEQVFNGMQLPDIYQIVDGDEGAVLFRGQGKHAAPFGGVKPEGRRVNFLIGEWMVFDKDSLLNDLITIVPGQQVLPQITGKETPPPPVSKLDELIVPNPQTSVEFRDEWKAAIRSIHGSYDEGKDAAIAALASPDVKVSNAGIETTGREAFVDAVSQFYHAFPDLIYHDEKVLTDGHLAATSWVWQGTHTGNWTGLNGTTIAPTHKPVRGRGFYFFEIGKKSQLVDKVTIIWDAASIESQLNGGPLAP